MPESRVTRRFCENRSLSRKAIRPLPFSGSWKFQNIWCAGCFVSTIKCPLSYLSSGRTSPYKTVAKYPNLLCGWELNLQNEDSICPCPLYLDQPEGKGRVHWKKGRRGQENKTANESGELIHSSPGFCWQRSSISIKSKCTALNKSGQFSGIELSNQIQTNKSQNWWSQSISQVLTTSNYLFKFHLAIH